MSHTPRSTLLQRFRRDASGNVLAIMAASLLPMMAGVGAAVDMSRNYMAKSRLQQACDAGVLAGRKAQATSTYTPEAQNQAQRYFSFNYPAGLYGSQSTAFSSSSAVTNEVVGTASTFVPATISKVVGYQGTNLAVNCTAKLDIANTDVMFVLDVTGSMNCPSDAAVTCGGNGDVEYGSGTQSRIGALRQAIKDFHGVLEGTKGSAVQTRYGYVPYSNTVNVGSLIRAKDATYLSDRVFYQTRIYPPPTVTTVSATNNRNCQAANQVYDNSARTCTTTTQGDWIYGRYALNTSGYKGMAATKTPSEIDGSTSTWAGCIEERKTVSDASFVPVSAAALDLDIDTAPTSDDNTKWKPFWPEVEWLVFSGNRANWKQYTDYYKFGQCPVAAKLVESRTASEVDTYVTSLKAGGPTYHDIGMIWGLRLLSPTGIWGTHNQTTSNGQPITRNIIFMTDGIMQPDANGYSAYGSETLDQRVSGGSTTPDLTERHNRRFLAMCNYAKSHDIRVWAVAFGTPLNQTKLSACADPGRAFEAKNATELNNAFRRIASSIAQLRLTR